MGEMSNTKIHLKRKHMFLFLKKLKPEQQLTFDFESHILTVSLPDFLLQCWGSHHFLQDHFDLLRTRDEGVILQVFGGSQRPLLLWWDRTNSQRFLLVYTWVQENFSPRGRQAMVTVGNNWEEGIKELPIIPDSFLSLWCDLAVCFYVALVLTDASGVLWTLLLSGQLWDLLAESL